MALPQNLRDIQFFIWPGCWVPRSVWDLSQPCCCICGQLGVSQMAFLILSGSAPVSGSELAYGWFRVVLAWITRVTQLCPLCLSSSRSPVQTCPHSNGHAWEREWDTQEAFQASSWNNYPLAKVHGREQVTRLNSASRNGKRDATHDFNKRCKLGRLGGSVG